MSNQFQASSNYDNVNPKIIQFYQQEGIILDLGCSTGRLAAKIKDLNPQARIYGLDLFPLPTEQSAVFTQFYLNDLDTEELPAFPEKFDLIILGDVLEHLKRPDLLLNNLKQHLAPQGQLIISVPNIAHYRSRLNLLLGNFDYTETGIMDKTHLRFFTEKTIRNLISEAGYLIENSDYIFYDKLKFVTKILPRPLLNIFYRLFSVQFVFKVRGK